jgi:hypothetical protein
LSSIQRRKTTTRNGSSRGEENGEREIDVILDVDGIEDEIIKAFSLIAAIKRRESFRIHHQLEEAHKHSCSVSRERELSVFYQ